MRQKLIGKWTLDDLFKLMEESYQLVRQAQGRVDYITEVGDRAHLPVDFLSSVRQIEQYVIKQPNIGVNVIVSTSSLYKIFYRAGSILAPRGAKIFRFANTVDEARALIAQERGGGNR